MSKKRIKPSPEVPWYVWYDLDGCWFCKHKNGCHNCKVMKKYRHKQIEEQKNKEKKDFLKSVKNGTFE